MQEKEIISTEATNDILSDLIKVREDIIEREDSRSKQIKATVATQEIVDPFSKMLTGKSVLNTSHMTKEQYDKLLANGYNVVPKEAEEVAGQMAKLQASEVESKMKHLADNIISKQNNKKEIDLKLKIKSKLKRKQARKSRKINNKH